MKTYQIRLSNKILITLSFLFLEALGVLSIIIMFREAYHTNLLGQLKIVFFVLGLLMFCYMILYTFSFKIVVNEDKIEMQKPPLGWHQQEKYSLNWDEIEGLEAQRSLLLLEATRYILKPKKVTRKRGIWFNTMLENFPELVQIILQKVPTEEALRSEIEGQVKRVTRKWPLSLPWTIALVMIVIVVAINVTMTLLRWPQ